HPLHVGSYIYTDYLENEVSSTRDVVTLYDLLDTANGSNKFLDVLFVVPLQGSHNKGTHAKPDFRRIDHRMIAANHSRPFELIHPLERWSWRKPNFLRQLSVGDIGVRL